MFWSLFDKDILLSLLNLLTIFFDIHLVFFLLLKVLFQFESTEFVPVSFEFLNCDTQNVFNQLIALIFFQIIQEFHVQVAQLSWPFLCRHVLSVSEKCFAFIIFRYWIHQGDKKNFMILSQLENFTCALIRKHGALVLWLFIILLIIISNDELHVIFSFLILPLDDFFPAL